MSAADLAQVRVFHGALDAEHIREVCEKYPQTQATNEPGAPMHDAHSHAADMTRYAAQAAPMMDDEEGMTMPARRILQPVLLYEAMI